MSHWTDSAPCVNEPRTFDVPRFGTGRHRENLLAKDRERLRRARELCASCPVLSTCRRDPMVQESEGFRHGELWVALRADKGTRHYRLDVNLDGAA